MRGGCKTLSKARALHYLLAFLVTCHGHGEAPESCRSKAVL